MTPFSRRAFLQRSLAAGGSLAVGTTWAATDNPDQPAPKRAPAAPITVVTAPVSTDANPRAKSWGYLPEVLSRAGLFFETLAPDHLARLFERAGTVVVLAGNLPLTAEQRQTLTTWVRQGGSLLALGGTSGLDELCGVQDATPLAEGWLKIAPKEHPVTAGLRSSLHVFGGCAFKKNTATALAGVENAQHAHRGAALVEHAFGQGRVLLVGPDLLFSIVHFQQGVPVLQDARRGPDDASLVNDGTLKAEDGMVVDWERDRTPLAPDHQPVFLEPISDELREIILRGIFHLAREANLLLPLLWYWPGAIQAVGHISHDTDGHDPALAVALLEALNRCQVKSSWCTLYPGGYPEDFYRKLQDQEFEIALHYDAMTGGPRTSWSKDNFLFQHAWLRQAAGLESILTNKNHYTRWEGRLDFLRWCEEAGLRCDQTRGPSKKGCLGFPLGGSQPYFPLDDELSTPRLIPVLEINMLAQDPVVTHPPEYDRVLLDSAARHHGVAHFLYHPAHIQKPGVAEALAALVDYGRSRNTPWWTARQIWQWESLRRNVTARFPAPGRVTLRAPKPLSQATLLVLRPAAGPRPLQIAGQPVSGAPRTLHGFEFDAATLDLSGEIHVEQG